MIVILSVIISGFSLLLVVGHEKIEKRFVNRKERKERKERMRKKIKGRVRKKEVIEVESSEEEEERLKVNLEPEMLVKIDGTKHYMREVNGIPDLLFTYPDGRLRGQYIRSTQQIEPIDLDN